MVVGGKNKIYNIIPVLLAFVFALASFYLPIKYIIALFLFLIFLFLLLNNIELGLMGAVLLLPFLPDIVSLLYMYGLVFIFLYQGLIKDKKWKLEARKEEAPIILYLLVIVFSTITSIMPGLNGSLRDLSLHLAGLSFLFIAINTVENKNSLNKIFNFLIFAASLVSIYGLYQYIVGVEIDPTWVDAENNPDIKTRIYSVFYNPNILAEYLIMIIPISVALFWNTKKLKKKIVYFVTSILMSLALVLTMSRGGWLGFAFSAFIFILLVEKRLLLSVIPISIAGIYLLPQSIINRILSIKNIGDSSNAYRLKLWRITGEIIKDNWIAGVGFGHIPFKETFNTYIRTMLTYHSHNTFLQVAVELGIPGLIVFLIFLFVIFKYGIKAVKNTNDKYIETVGSGLIAALSGLLLHGLVENVLYIPRIIITFWMLISFILIIIRLENRESLSKGE